jgi:hypothetical protein
MKNKIKNTAQQGDVILKRIDNLPLGKRIKINKNDKGEMVLAEGETTGHYHGILEQDSELLTIDNKVYLNLKENATLTHQEHHHIELEAGIWEVGRVQEYDYFSKMVRPVAD